jgi:hypothetical protein
MVGLAGFELATSPLSGVRSNQLSYRPVRLRHHIFSDRMHGGADQDRTDDLLNANQALSQLSYSPRLELFGFPYYPASRVSRKLNGRKCSRGQLDVPQRALWLRRIAKSYT